MTIDEQVEVVIGWFNETPEKFREIFKNTPKEKLVSYHDSLGRQIRNHFKLWTVEWEPEIKGGVDYSPNHPDAVSMKIIETVWERVNKGDARKGFV